MAFQIVVVVEANEKSRSDYIYIRSVLEKWYNLHLLNNVKISPVFMCGRGNFDKKKVANEIKSYKKRYSSVGSTYVIYCFDTDKYDSNPDDQKQLAKERAFCKDNGYEFVWFCHDIEEVFLGKSIVDSEKTDRARKYASNHEINSVNQSYLKADAMSRRKSNLMKVLDDVFERGGYE